MGADARRCSDYESEQVADTAIFSSPAVSLPSVIVTLRQVQNTFVRARACVDGAD